MMADAGTARPIVNHVDVVELLSKIAFDSDSKVQGGGAKVLKKIAQSCEFISCFIISLF